MTVYEIPTAARPTQLIAVSINDIGTATLPPPRFVIDEIAPRGVVTLLSGHGGSGKSLLSLILAAHVAAGRGWGPFDSVMGRALYLSLEDAAEIVRFRLRRILDHYQLDADAVAANLVILDGTEAEPLAIETNAQGVRHVARTAAHDELERAAVGASLIVIDNASDAYAANENDRTMVRDFVRGLARIGKKNDAAVVLLAHLDKAAARYGSNGQSFSGSTAWHNSARSRLALVEQDGRLMLLHEKSNHGRVAEPVPLRWTDGGVLLPTTVEAAQEAAQARDTLLAAEDAEHVARAIQAAHAAGVSVSVARTGNYSTKHCLATFDIPRELTAGKAERFWRALDLLIAEHRVTTEDYQNDWRKTRQRFVPSAPVVCAAPVPPYPPVLAQAQGAPLRQSETDPNRRATGAPAQPPAEASPQNPVTETSEVAAIAARIATERGAS